MRLRLSAVQKKKWLVAPLLLALLSGCSWEKLNPFYSDPNDIKNKMAKLQPLADNHQPTVLWQNRSGSAEGYAFKPAVVGETTYVAAADGSVTRLDAGDAVWKVNPAKNLSAGVGASRQVVVVATPRGEVIALDPASGERKWSVPVGAEVLAAPAVSENVVVVRSSDNRLFGLDVQDGKRKWVYQRSTPPLALRSTAGVLLADGNTLFAGFPGGKLVAVNLTSGAMMWEGTVATPKGSTELERVADITSLPVILGREICAAAYQGRVTCFDLGNGSQLWNRAISSDAGLAIDPKAVYITDDNGAVHALDAANGASLWKQGDLYLRGVSRPVLMGDYVAVADREGDVHLLNKTTGAFAGRISLDSALAADMQLAPRGVVAQTRSGKVYTLAP